MRRPCPAARAGRPGASGVTFRTTRRCKPPRTAGPRRGGSQRHPAGGWGVRLCARPAAGHNFLAYSRLGTDCIDIYRLARLDPAVPIEETAGGAVEAAVPPGAAAGDRYAQLQVAALDSER